MPAADMPAAEVDIDVDLVTRLVASQFPHLASRPVTPLAFGWDNALFRLGDDLVARLPRRAAGVPLVAHEQRWLPELAVGLPLPVPAPVGNGVPGEGYPWPWSICPFFEGTSVLAHVDAGRSLADPVAEALRLGEFLATFHRPAPSDAPHNPYRGVPLVDRNARFRDDLIRAHDDVERVEGVANLEAAWAEALETPSWTGSPVWVHGDVHPGNLVTDGRRITAVVDLGDLCAGDPASDLVVAWMLFDGEARDAFRSTVEVDDDTWRRGHGWGLCIGLALLATSADNPPYRRLGERTLHATLAG